MTVAAYREALASRNTEMLELLAAYAEGEPAEALGVGELPPPPALCDVAAGALAQTMHAHAAHDGGASGATAATVGGASAVAASGGGGGTRDGGAVAVAIERRDFETAFHLVDVLDYAVTEAHVQAAAAAGAPAELVALLTSAAAPIVAPGHHGAAMHEALEAVEARERAAHHARLHDVGGGGEGGGFG